MIYIQPTNPEQKQFVVVLDEPTARALSLVGGYAGAVCEGLKAYGVLPGYRGEEASHSETWSALANLYYALKDGAGIRPGQPRR